MRIRRKLNASLLFGLAKRTQAIQETERIKALPVLAHRQRPYKRDSTNKDPLEREEVTQKKQKRQKKRRKRVES